MSYQIEKTIHFNTDDLVVYFQKLTDNHNVIWTQESEEGKTFSRKSDALAQASLIPEDTTVVKND